MAERLDQIEGILRTREALREITGEIRTSHKAEARLPNSTRLG
jgi:hypothetical protein